MIFKTYIIPYLLLSHLRARAGFGLSHHVSDSSEVLRIQEESREGTGQDWEVNCSLDFGLAMRLEMVLSFNQGNHGGKKKK